MVNAFRTEKASILLGFFKYLLPIAWDPNRNHMQRKDLIKMRKNTLRPRPLQWQQPSITGFFR